jgi:heme oxygenase
MATLRAATAEQHARTESLVPVLDPALGLGGYAAILLRFRVVYTVLEDALAQVDGWPAGFDVEPRRWSPRLERDLGWLDERGVLGPQSFDFVAMAPMTAPVPTVPSAMGILYVLEGASLGGQLIARRLGPRLGVTATAGASFFAGGGDATGRRWREFGATVDRWGAKHPREWRDVIASARATFDTIAAPFATSPVVP